MLKVKIINGITIFDYFDWISSQSENDIEGKQECGENPENVELKGNLSDNPENVEHNTNMSSTYVTGLYTIGCILVHCCKIM